MPNPADIELLAHATQITAGVGTSVDLADADIEGLRRAAVTLVIPVTAYEVDPTPPVDAEPGLAITIQTRDDTADAWGDVSTLDIEATGRYTLSAGDLGRYIRISWEFGLGLDSADFGAEGQAHVVYCDPRDITRVAVPERSISEISASARAEACLSASSEADDYIDNACTLPLVSWTGTLRDHTARLAAGIIFAHRGCDPQGSDANVLLERDRALKWLDRFANGRIGNAGIVDSTPDDNEGGSVVVSNPSREW